MLDDKISRVKALIQRRDEIDAELAQLLGVEPKARRGRPPKEKGATEAAPESAASS